MGNKPSIPSSGPAALAAPGGGGSVGPTNSNLKAMNKNLQGILGAAENTGTVKFKEAFNLFKETVISCISPDFQGRLLQINDSNSLEAIKEIRDDINVKIAALNTQFRQLMAKMPGIKPDAVFKSISDKYSEPLLDIYASLTATLKAESSKAGKLIEKKKVEAQKLKNFASSFPAVPTHTSGTLGGARKRHAKRKTRKAHRSHSRRKVAA
jgi:hypothetical protein